MHGPLQRQERDAVWPPVKKEPPLAIGEGWARLEPGLGSKQRVRSDGGITPIQP